MGMDASERRPYLRRRSVLVEHPLQFRLLVRSRQRKHQQHPCLHGGEIATAQQKLAERKFVERAKGLLMKARNLSEDEAYHTLRRMAMERNRRMGDVAKSVIEMAELLN